MRYLAQFCLHFIFPPFEASTTITLKLPTGVHVSDAKSEETASAALAEEKA